VRAYTVLRLLGPGSIFLFEEHVRRLGEASRPALQSFSERAPAGVYAAVWDGTLSVTARPGSRLREGMRSRTVVSPYASHRGCFVKPSPPCGYDLVRAEGVVSLLTDGPGRVLHEACVAGLVAWDGAGLVLVPEDVPRVSSTAEAALAGRLSHRRAPLEVEAGWPLLLINAVVGTCSIDGAPFPADVRAAIDAALGSPPRASD